MCRLSTVSPARSAKLEGHSQKSHLSSPKLCQACPELQGGTSSCSVQPPPCSAWWHQCRVAAPVFQGQPNPHVGFGFQAAGTGGGREGRKLNTRFGLWDDFGRQRKARRCLAGSSRSEGAEWPAPALWPGF